MKKIIIILILISSSVLFSQQITNFNQKIKNGRIVITYDLQGNTSYDITITATKNGKTIIPSGKCLGFDYGTVTPGKDKIIWWAPALECRGWDAEGWTITLKAEWNFMVFVQGGTFEMGSNKVTREKPIHSVTVDDFYISETEVTQAEWKAVMGNNPSRFKGDNLPVERVSWYDAVEFCNKKSEMEGLTPCYSGKKKKIKCNFNANGYRLPTEAEWEYAARGGIHHTDDYKYAGTTANLGDYAWYYSNSSSQTHAVGTKLPNQLGIYDMSGNVYEWCNDWYDSNYYSSSPQNNPTGPTNGSYRVLRGGSWDNYADYCRVAFRGRNDPNSGYLYYGFRFLRAL